MHFSLTRFAFLCWHLHTNTVYEVPTILLMEEFHFWSGRVNSCGNLLPNTNTWKTKQNRHPIFHSLYRKQWPSGKQQNQRSPPCDLEVALELQSQGKLPSKTCSASTLSRKWNLERLWQWQQCKRRWSCYRMCWRPTKRSSKVIKVSFLPKKKGTNLPSRGSKAQWCLQHTCLYKPKCKYGSWKSPERPQLDAGWGLVSPRTIRLVSAMISLESGVNQW